MAKTQDSRDVFAVVRTRLDGIRTLLEDMDADAAERLMQMLLKAKRIFVAGKGRSGFIAQCFAMRLMQMGFEVHVPGEATCSRIKRGDLLVGVSCSGTTMSTVQMARIARQVKARVVAVTALPDSVLAESADHVVVVPVTDKIVKKRYRYVLGPYNNTLFEQAVLLYFDAMVYSILERKGIPKTRLRERHANLE